VQQTTLSLDRDGNPLVVFRGAYINRIFSQYSPDGGTTWESATEIPDMRARPSDLDVYSMATDGAGTVHLLMVGYRSREATDDLLAPPGLWHLAWQGGRWTVVDAVMDNELYPEYPRLVIANGNELHATWFTRSREDLFDSERASYRVWYSSTFVNAPAVAPLPLFTPVPEATARPTATALPPQPTPTALPAWALEAAPVTEPPRWESLALQTVGVALLPVLALIGGVMLVRRRKKG
jgi:hypothetical protein